MRQLQAAQKILSRIEQSTVGQTTPILGVSSEYASCISHRGSAASARGCGSLVLRCVSAQWDDPDATPRPVQPPLGLLTHGRLAPCHVLFHLTTHRHQTAACAPSAGRGASPRLGSRTLWPLRSPVEEAGGRRIESAFARRVGAEARRIACGVERCGRRRIPHG